MRGDPQLAGVVVQPRGVDPTVTVQAAFSRKGKQAVSQPIRQALAAEIKRWFAGRSPDDAAFLVPQETAVMLRLDHAEAGLAYKTPDGKFRDFHALRHTYITEAGRHVRSFAALQQLARHSTPTLTARYAHALASDTRKAVDSLYGRRRRRSVSPAYLPEPDRSDQT